jgi:hypothetical protein
MKCPNPKCKSVETAEPLCPTCGLPLENIVTFPNSWFRVYTRLAFIAGTIILWIFLLKWKAPIGGYPVFAAIASFLLIFETVSLALPSRRDVLVISGRPNPPDTLDRFGENETVWRLPGSKKLESVEIPLSKIASINGYDLEVPASFIRDDPWVNVHVAKVDGAKIKIMPRKFQRRRWLMKYFRTFAETQLVQANLSYEDYYYEKKKA